MRTENNILYLCDEGKVFRRKSDGFIMGDGLCLGIKDSIKNYEEIDNPEPIKGTEATEEKEEKTQEE